MVHDVISILGKCQTIEDRLVPDWTMLLGNSTTGFRETDNPSSAHDPSGDGEQEVKRERLGNKTKAKNNTVRGRYSFLWIHRL